MKRFYTEGVIEAGCDEAGRGCLAGPVVAASVVFPPYCEDCENCEDCDNHLFNALQFNTLLKELNDSKQLSEKKRNELRPLIMECAMAYGIGLCSPAEIDKINILNASFLAMHRALEKVSETLCNLSQKQSQKSHQKDSLKNFQNNSSKKSIEFIIVDGNRFTPYKDNGMIVPHKCIVKGDALYASIAAASILAKTERDNIMTTLSKDFPQYNWEGNKGYPTKAHRAAIEKFGTTIHHRMSFALLPEPTLF